MEQALLSTFRDTELMERVAERATQRAQAERPQLRKRLKAINADIAHPGHGGPVPPRLRGGDHAARAVRPPGR